MKKNIHNIQIYGERCSGTNYLEYLVRQNLRDVRIGWDFGSKHFFHPPGVETATDHLFLILFRNPFDWLRSLHHMPWHVAPELRQLDFSTFIRKEWWCIFDEPPHHPEFGQEMMHERDPETGRRFANVLRLRAAKIRNWQALRTKTRKNVFLRYEDLVATPRAFLDSVSQTFGIRRTWFYWPVRRYKGNAARFKPRVYAPLSAADLDFIVHELDAELEASIGYDIEALAARHRAAG